MGTLAKFHDEGFVEMEGEFIEGYTNALSFDYDTVTANSQIQGDNSHTIEAWLFVDAIPASRMGILNLNPQSTGGHHWLLGIDGKLQLGIWSGGSGSQVFPTCPIAEWFHLSVTYDSVSMYLRAYINGSEVASTDTSLATNRFKLDGTIIMGDGVPAELNFVGKMSDIRIWSIKREPADILNDMNRNVTGSANLVRYWRCTDPYSSTLTDFQSKNDGTINGATRICTESLKIDQDVFGIEGELVEDRKDALNFNTGKVAVPSNTSLRPPSITIECWANATTLDSWNGIVTNKSGAGDGLNLQMGTSQGIASLVGSGASYTYIKTSWIPVTNRWYHIAIVHDSVDSSNRLYVDGVLESPVVTHALAYTDQNLHIGEFYINNLPFKGRIRDLRIWNTPRTQAQIQENMDKQLTGNETGLVGYWKCNESYGTIVKDASVNKFDGTISGTVTREYIETKNKFSLSKDLYVVSEISDTATNGLTFDGASSYVDIPHTSSLSLGAYFTFEALINPTANVTEGMIFNKENSYEWALIGGELRWAIMTAGTWEWRSTGIYPPLNEWSHVALSYDGVRVYSYLNGSSGYILTDFDGGSIYSSGYSLRIGRRASSSYFYGKIADVRLWNTYRTQTDIATNMNKIPKGNETGLIGLWRFDEKSGSVAKDKTSYKHDGTIYNATRIFD